LEAIVARPDGTKILRERGDGDDSKRLGESVGESLLRNGAEEILEEVYDSINYPESPDAALSS
jgi:hydroxymethylbilane synthase